MRRDVLLQRGDPVDTEDLESDAREEGDGGDHRRHSDARVTGDLGRRGQERERRDEQRARRPPAQREHSARNEPRALRANDRAVGGRAAQVPLRYQRSEHREAGRGDEVAHRGANDDHPQPFAGAEFVPALDQLADDRFAALDDHSGDLHPHEDQRACEVGDRVERDRPAGPGGGHRNAAHAGADDGAGALREPKQRVGRLQQLAFDDFRHDRLGGRKEEGRRGPANGREQSQVPRLRNVYKQ